jgi:hypothetical protein
MTSKKADGNVCYTIEGVLVNTMSATLIFKDATGKQAGTGTYNLTTNDATIMCDGASFDAAAVRSCAGVLRLPSLPTGGTPPAGGDCTAGTCAP